MTLRTWARIALGYLFAVSVVIGVWALAAPQSFYDDFPGLGRTWVAVDGPYNEHLVRDVGALNLAIAVAFAAAWVRLDPVTVKIAAGVALVWGVPHAIYHFFNTDGLDTVDVIANLGGLVLFAVLGGGLWWTADRVDPSLSP